MGEQGHGGLGEVAALGGDQLFVVGLDQHRPGKAEESGGVGEYPDDIGAAFDLFVQPFQGLSTSSSSGARLGTR